MVKGKSKKPRKRKKPGLPPVALKHLMGFYTDKAELYEELSKREDYRNDVIKAVSKIVDLRGKTVLDLGTGTGRFALDLARKAKLVYAADTCKPMLRVLRRLLRSRGKRNVRVLHSTYSRIQLPRESVDVVVSVWSFPAHSKNWDKDLREVKRVLKPGGMMVLLDNYHGGEYFRIKEKMPTPFFKDFNYDLHEWMRKQGFKRKVVSTLMNPGSKRNVERLCGPFFGYDLSTYLLARDKTCFEMKLSMFYWKKK